MDRKAVLKALVGSHNYNLNTETSDRDYKVFVLPTFEELYKGEMYSKSIIGEEEDFDIHDVRKLPDLFFKANINFLEVLFSKDIHMASYSCLEINEIFEMRNEIARMNLPHLFNACGGMHLNKMKHLYKGTDGTQHLVDKFGYDTKQALHAYRVMNFIVRFAQTDFEDFEWAMTYLKNDIEFMMTIKNGGFTADRFENFAKWYHDKHFQPLKTRYYSFLPDVYLKHRLEDLIMNMVKVNI